MCLTKFMRSCKCRISTMEDFEVKPSHPSPMDTFGYEKKCCWCISLKIGVIIIGIITLIWASFLLSSKDKTLKGILPDKKSTPYSIFQYIYVSIIVLLYVACGILFLGIYKNNFNLINVFVWYGFLLNVISILMHVTEFVLKIIVSNEKILRSIIKGMLALFWNFLFLYFLIIVNSYKMTTLWT